jgi:putative flavoprotein involved in K+ transport
MTTTTAPPAEAAATARTWLPAFSDALALGGAEAAALFTQDCFWRDLIAFTWNIRTFEGREEITEMLDETLASVQPSGWTITDGEEPADEGLVAHS